MGTFPDELHKFTSGTEAPVEAGRKGGQAGKGSPAKSLAAKLRELKKKGVGDETVEWLHNAMESSDLSLYQVLAFIRSNMGKTTSPKEAQAWSRLLLDFHKIRHGTKETKHELDITKKEYKFIIETTVADQEYVRDQIQADSQAVISVGTPERQKDD